MKLLIILTENGLVMEAERTNKWEVTSDQNMTLKLWERCKKLYPGIVARAVPDLPQMGGLTLRTVGW